VLLFLLPRQLHLLQQQRAPLNTGAATADAVARQCATATAAASHGVQQIDVCNAGKEVS
jgi:hypothetical protein